MADKSDNPPGKIQPRPNDPALSKGEALAGWEITATDIARTRARWARLVAGFEARIKIALTPTLSQRERGQDDA